MTFSIKSILINVAIVLIGFNSHAITIFVPRNTCVEKHADCMSEQLAARNQAVAEQCNSVLTMGVPDGQANNHQRIRDKCLAEGSILVQQGAAKFCEKMLQPCLLKDGQLPTQSEGVGVVNEKGPDDEATTPLPPQVPAEKGKDASATTTNSAKKPASTTASEEVKPPVGTNNASTASTYTGNSSADIQTAQNALNDVQTCCTNPSACNSGGSGLFGGDLGSQVGNLGAAALAGGGNMANTGMLAACQGMGSLGGSGNKSNSGYAGLCYSKITTCTNITDPLAMKYANAGDNTTANTLGRIGDSCGSYMSRYRELASQATQSAGSGDMGNYCAQMIGQMQAMKSQSAPQAPPYNDQLQSVCPPGSTDPMCVNCAKNPGAQGCPQASRETSNSAGFKSKGNDVDGDFGTPDLSNVPPAGTMDGGVQQPYESAAANQVPNNSGGGIPGQGGTTTPAAGKVGASLSEGYDTDRIHGFMGGGYSAQAGKMNTGTDSRGGYSQAAGDASGGYQGLDLKKYLPGAQNDPNRKIAGLSSPSPDIGPKYGDIFKRITDRIQVLCRYNRLLDCENKH